MTAQTYTIDQLKEIVGLVNAQKNDPASTTLTAPTLHGPFPGNAAQYGIFSGAGVRPARFSTLARPNSLVGILGLSRSEFTDEILEVMTGVTAASGTNATGFCGDPPTVGQGKVCQQIYKFGKYYVKTDLNSIPEIGQLRNRADVPADIINAGPTGNPLIPDIMYRLAQTRSQAQYEFWRIGVEFERSIDVVAIQGDITVASANSEHGHTVEFNGLDLQVKTGYTDAVTGLACPAMDSAVITYGAAVTTTGTDGRALVVTVEDTFYGLQQRASAFGMEGVQWAIVMRREAFRALVNAYACDYNNYTCTGAAGTPHNNDAATVNGLRLAMQNGQYLLVMGQQIPVVFSEGIPQTTPAANTMESDMYIIPVSWQGMPLTRLEYFPMDNQYATEFSNFADNGTITMNNGLWIVGARDTGLCKEYHFANRLRLILETPFLAARIDNLQYTFAAPIRNALPGASYYANGGSTYRE